MVKLAILATLEAKSGKEEQVSKLLENALALVNNETGTINWYAFRISPTTFGIFDTFESEDARQAHLAGKVVGTLLELAPDLFTQPPGVIVADVLACK